MEARRYGMKLRPEAGDELKDKRALRHILACISRAQNVGDDIRKAVDDLTGTWWRYITPPSAYAGIIGASISMVACRIRAAIKYRSFAVESKKACTSISAYQARILSARRQLRGGKAARL